MKAPVEVLGRGGWISRGCLVWFGGGGEEAGGIFARFDEEQEGAIRGGWAETAGFLDGGKEGNSKRGSLVLRGEEWGDVEGGCAWIRGFSEGGGEDSCNRGRFAAGDEAGRVGEGELESKGRLR